MAFLSQLFYEVSTSLCSGPLSESNAAAIEKDNDGISRVGERLECFVSYEKLVFVETTRIMAGHLKAGVEHSSSLSFGYEPVASYKQRDFYEKLKIHWEKRRVLQFPGHPVVA